MKDGETGEGRMNTTCDPLDIGIMPSNKLSSNRKFAYSLPWVWRVCVLISFCMA